MAIRTRKRTGQATLISAMTESIARLCEEQCIEKRAHLAVMYGGPGWACYQEDFRMPRFSSISAVTKAARKAQAAMKAAEYPVQVRIGLISHDRLTPVRLYRIP